MPQMQLCTFEFFCSQRLGISIPFWVLPFRIEISAQSVLICGFWCGIHILFPFSPDNRVNTELLHDAVNAISAVVCTIEAIDPIRHPTVPQNMLESFILFLNHLGNDLVFLFCFGNLSRQPLAVCSPCQTKLSAHPVDAPAPLCRIMLNCQIFRGESEPAKLHRPSNSFAFFTKILCGIVSSRTLRRRNSFFARSAKTICKPSSMKRPRMAG